MTFNKLTSEAEIQKVTEGLTERGFLPAVVDSGAEALTKIIELIPEGASVMNGSSQTLEEIGFTEYLKSNPKHWQDLHQNILAEKDPSQLTQRRRESTLSDYYLGSVHAITQTGEMVIASGSGSQLPHLVYTSPNLILVVSTQKIVPTLSDAIQRLDEHVVPMENDKMQKKYGKNTMKSKTLIFHRENPINGRKIHVILVKEKLGY